MTNFMTINFLLKMSLLFVCSHLPKFRMSSIIIIIATYIILCLVWVMASVCTFKDLPHTRHRKLNLDTSVPNLLFTLYASMAMSSAFTRSTYTYVRRLYCIWHGKKSELRTLNFGAKRWASIIMHVGRVQDPR